MAYIISLMSEKGGCAKTTSAVNIAGELSIAMNEIKHKHKPVLLIDTDPAGGSTTDIGPADKKPKKYLADMIIDFCQTGQRSDIRDAVIKTNFPGLDLMPSSSRLGIATEIIRTQEIAREKILTQIFNGLEQLYDWIIIDTLGAKHNALAINVVSLSLPDSKAYVAIPVEPEQKNIKSFYNTKSIIEAVNSAQINDVNIIATFLTKVDERRSYDKVILEKGEELFGRSYLPCPIHFSGASVRLATEKHMPISYVNPNSRIAKDYENLCAGIVERILGDWR